MSKDMGGLLGILKGNPASGIGLAGNPLSGLGLLKGIFGGHGGGDEEGQPAAQNPGEQMFNGVGPGGVDATGGDSKKSPNFGSKFAGNLSDLLFQKAMMGFMGR